MSNKRKNQKAAAAAAAAAALDEIMQYNKFGGFIYKSGYIGTHRRSKGGYIGTHK
jgi:hypothetical protein